MEFPTVRPDFVKYEMRQTTGTPAWQQEVKKRGFFGRLLSGIGRIFGAVAAPLSFIFPPAALAAAGMYGVSQIGDQIQARAYAKTLQDRAQNNPQNVSFPGLEMGGPQGLRPAHQALSPHNEMVLNVLFTRDGASQAMSHQI